MGISELVVTVHAFGVKIFGQLTPDSDWQGKQAVPSAIPNRIPPENLPQRAIKEHEKRGLRSAYLDAFPPCPIPSVLSTVRCMVNNNAGLEQYIDRYKRSEPFEKHWTI